MARPQTVSDEEIMQAAGRVIARRGYGAFTLAEVADEVGLSRTAIILRFKSTLELKRRITKETISQLQSEMDALPVNVGGNGLIELAASIGRHTPNRAGIAALMSMSQGNLDDKDLADLEKQRGVILMRAIAARMPKTALPHAAAVDAFAAHLTGSITHWNARGGASPTAFLVKRTQDWLTLAHIPFTRTRARPKARK